MALELLLDFGEACSQHPGRQLFGALISRPNTSASRMMLEPNAPISKTKLKPFLKAVGN